MMQRREDAETRRHGDKESVVINVAASSLNARVRVSRHQRLRHSRRALRFRRVSASTSLRVYISPRLRVSRLSLLSLALISSLLIAGCSRRDTSNIQDGGREINVAAASNLTDAFAELGKQFTARTGVRVVYSFGATADLAKQIENGAPFDLFAAADVEHVETLNRQGLLVDGTLAVYARGRLVLWIPQGSGAQVARLEDLTSRTVGRVGIAKPDVAPYGRATVEALRMLNLWSQVEAKVIYGQNVSQVKQYAATGNVDVAFLPLALTREGEGRAIEVDENLHQPIEQALALIKASAKQDDALRFRDFVLGAEGQSLLERFGYRKPQ
ncbi:MAG: molybdate transport system substrate-binding protein [Blastocatellia bacterium]|nr:molybdate transport system substrate-binding protein [Blastocatellia bacterium]